MKSDLLAAMVTEVANVMIANADELTRLDQAIGDGDHGVNVRRGFEAVLDRLAEFRVVPAPAAIEAIGVTLIMTVGGAFGPLIGTALLTSWPHASARAYARGSDRERREGSAGRQGTGPIRSRP